MTDEAFITQLLRKGEEAKQKVRTELSGLSLAQLNWKYSPESWSIAQCLEHLMASDSCYFSDLEKISTGRYRMSAWEKFSPLTALNGRIMKYHMQEDVKRKLTAPKKIAPSASNLGADIVERYQENFDTFLNHVAACRSADLDKTIITSPTIRIVTYSLRDALTFLLTHEHRHLNQAIRVKAREQFPKQ